MVKGKTPRILLGFLVLVLVAIPLLVAACDNGGDDDVTPTPTVTPAVTPTPTTTSALEDIKWILESYGELVNLEDVLTDTGITAEFVGSEGTVKGSAGCNSYSGSYEVEDGQLSIPGPMAVTMMHCADPEGAMEQEQEYLEILQAAESYSIEEEELQINCGDQVLIYAAETPTVTPLPTTTSALEDTKWILESYGELVNLEHVLTDTRITAEFVSSEGTVEGSAGCNSYSGSYEVEDSQLSIPGPIAATEMYCADPEGVMEQEQQYLEILQAAESYSIEEEELQINCGDQVLIYAAE
jgi:heat shock protein HslJ